ncbi:methyltransferase-like protein 25 [Trichosurus vulpecula]|uniref:methyltransferase-like protein 25 n=1 Tax=Trichosurus vulpecula TaxID=9337 RepID=UPI00186AD78D|nr:methyltransferase-like protein 25 [Trichosurus vulpecula]
MAAASPLPESGDLDVLRGKLRELLRFLRKAIPIANAHTVEFYTEDLWERFVGGSPDKVIEALRSHGLSAEAAPARWEERPLEGAGENSGFSDFSNIFCENSQKLVNVEAFALAAKYYSLPYFGVCTPLEQVLVTLGGNQQQKPGNKVKPDDFMNAKKCHEVQVMSELIGCIADFCGIRQVIDLGSGKGYLSSFLSMQYGLKVYGIDSSNVNTHGAKERNRKLKKHWRVYQTRSRAHINGQVLEKAKENTAQDKQKCKTNTKEKLLSINNSVTNEDKRSVSDSVLSDFTDAVISDVTRQMENHSDTLPQRAGSFFLENRSTLLNVLPVDAIKLASPATKDYGKLSEEHEEKKKTVSIKDQAKESNESGIYSPLTSYITAESELCDIITDLEDCIMVGLHTCGDLAPNTLRIFTSKSEIKGVCSVGCCYHLLSEKYEEQCKDYTLEMWGFPMCQYLKEEAWCCGRNARMSACLALERVAVGQGLATESLFYRAVLQEIIKEYYGITECDKHVGKVYSKSTSFLDYVRKSLKKLELDDSKLTEKMIMEYYEKYKPRMNELEAFNMLKVVLAPCIETLILMDRLCYLKEQDNIAWSALVKLFDPVKSPRCYAVTALKKQPCFQVEAGC